MEHSRCSLRAILLIPSYYSCCGDAHSFSLEETSTLMYKEKRNRAEKRGKMQFKWLSSPLPRHTPHTPPVPCFALNKLPEPSITTRGVSAQQIGVSNSGWRFEFLIPLKEPFLMTGTKTGRIQTLLILG